MKKIKLTIFDAGDVLYEIKRTLYIKETNKFLKKYNIPIQRADDEWNKIKNDLMIGRFSYTEGIKKWLGVFGKQHLYRKWIELEKKILPKILKKKHNIEIILQKLKENECKIAVLSNDVNNSKTKKEWLHLLNLAHYFDLIVTSHDIKVKKPHKKAYEYVLSYFNVKPQETIFIGHDEKELRGAKRVGINAKNIEWLNKFVEKGFVENI